MNRFLGGAGAAVGAKIVTGFAVAAMAATAAAAATEVASTGSLNPADWGRQVSHQVQVCKDTLRASGTRGIGQCVSEFAKQHGKLVSGSHRASDARDNSDDKSHGNSGNANGHSKVKDKNDGHGEGSSKGQGPTTHSTDSEPADAAVAFVITGT